MNHITKTLIHRGMQLFGIKEGIHSIVRKSRYDERVKEVYEYCTRFLYPDLPTKPNRVELLSGLLGTSVTQGVHLINYLIKSMTLPGAVCEFGIAQGATSALLANEIAETDKELWLFDSFKGLPKPSVKDVLKNDIYGLGAMAKYQGTMLCSPEEVCNRLNAIAFPPARTRLVSGDILKTVKGKIVPKAVCFAYVDVDFYEPCLATLQFLHTKLRPGGYVGIDDYNFFSHGIKTAVDEFLGSHPGEYEKTVSQIFVPHLCLLQRILR